jgi:xylan 1,4-beta-xylosidase
MLDRRVTARFTGLAERPYTLRIWRVDAAHGDLAVRWHALGGGADWPDEDQWRALTEADRLDEAQPPSTLTPAAGGAEVEVDLPMPGIVLVELTPG